MANKCWVLNKTLRTTPLHDDEGDIIDEGGVLIGKKGQEVEVVSFNTRERAVLISVNNELFSIGIEDLKGKNCR